MEQAETPISEKLETLVIVRCPHLGADPSEYQVLKPEQVPPWIGGEVLAQMREGFGRLVLGEDDWYYGAIAAEDTVVPDAG